MSDRDAKSIPMSDLKSGGGGGGAAGAQAFRVVHSQDALKNRTLGYPNNAISNTKYGPLTFLPKNLWEQFSLNINRYFLLIAVLQLFSVLTPVNPLSTWGPLIVIFAISAAKEAVDDWNRRTEDRAANERLVTVYRSTATGFVKQELQSQHVEVGDILYLREDEQVPCDILLLKSSGADGSAFITTTNLDGETNLKQRQAPMATRDRTEEEIWAFRGTPCTPSPPLLAPSTPFPFFSLRLARSIAPRSVDSFLRSLLSSLSVVACTWRECIALARACVG
jgi:magnesium-transporting ATPase (P-type)